MDELVRGSAALAVGVLTLAGPVLALLAYLRGRRLAVRVRLLEASVARLETAAATGHSAPVEAAVPARAFAGARARRRRDATTSPPAEPGRARGAGGAALAGLARGPGARPGGPVRGRLGGGAGARRPAGARAGGGAPRVRPPGVGRARAARAGGGRERPWRRRSAAGGLCALYGAALAAHLAYGLVEPGVAFLLLALASGLGAALGLRFGRWSGSWARSAPA